MISSQVEMEDMELLKLYNKGERDFSHHRLYPSRFNYEVNLSDKILININLNYSRLNDVNLSGSNLICAEFINADLKGANISNANLNGANLSRANLYYANISGANLCGVDLTDACLDYANLQDIIIDNDTKISEKYYLMSEIINTKVIGRKLYGVDLTFGRLIHSILTEARLENANLSNANCFKSNLERAILTDAILKNAYLIEANFLKANLERAILKNAKLCGANLENAKLTSANLSGANLAKCIITNADFENADFRSSNLTQTNLIDVRSLKGAIYNDETKFPNRFNPKTAQMIHEDDIKTKKYHNSEWIELLTKKKVKTVKSPPPRKGQQEFKEELKETYGYQCLISGCHIEQIIEAAHIIPYSDLNSHDVANGLLLRVDLHRLFDAHLIAIHPTTREVLISEQIAKDYQDIRGIEIESCLTGEDVTKQQDALRYHCEQCNWIDKRLLE